MKVTEIVIPEDKRSSIEDAAARGESMESLSQRMADLGLGKIVAIKLLKETKKIGLGEAKEMIHYSPAWAFRRAADEAFHEALYEAMTQDGWVEVSVPQDAEPSVLKTGTHS